MIRTIKRPEQNEKKIDVRVRDSGDSKTYIPKYGNTNKKYENSAKIVYPDGDSRKVSIIQRQEKTVQFTPKEEQRPMDADDVKAPKPNVFIKLSSKESNRPSDTEDGKPPKVNSIVKAPTRDKNRPTDNEDGKAADRKFFAKEAEKRAIMELKRIREKYALKTKNYSVPPNHVKKEDFEKNVTAQADVKSSTIDVTNKSQEVAQTCDIQRDVEEDVKVRKISPNYHRKPVIKTIGARNGYASTYKAVTFVEQKNKRKLDINIPNAAACYTKTNPSKFTETNSLELSSYTSVGEKPAIGGKKSPRRRELKKPRRIESPIHLIRDNRSPSTEVAKWAPSSVNDQTQPYYEAWVNTRLAAISRDRNINKDYFNDPAFLKAFQKALERPPTPDLYYSNFADERFTGKITIRQK